MQISSRFTVALHIFTCVDTFKDEHKVTSDFLAASINTNPVIIRKILTQLKNAGLINVIRGTGGIELTRDLKDITFYDVYQAIEPLEDGDKVFLQTVYNFAGAGEQVGFDVFRFDEDGKIAEHWDVMETLADKSTWANENGKF